MPIARFWLPPVPLAGLTQAFGGRARHRQPPPGGVGSGQVGQEFGRTSTSGRTFNLTCTNDVVFEHSGNVVLPSVEVVTLPAAAGTITFEYDAYDIPDRFVVELGGRVVVDTRYVGTSRSVAEVNAVLTRYGFTPTSQARIISPGSGSRSFQKPAGVSSAIVRVYAPLTGTAWNVTLKFSGSSCPGGSTPPPPQTRLYGSLYSSIESNCSNNFAGIAANYNTQQEARTAALNLCRTSGGTRCSLATDFGSAYAGSNRCAALAYGDSPTRCGTRSGRGDTESAAESTALALCRSSGFTSCTIRPGRNNSRFATCTD